MPTENVPRRAYELPLLQSLMELGGSAVPGDKLYRLIAGKMGFVPGIMAYDIVHAREKWVYSLQWVRHNLVKQGDLDGSQKGQWTLTEQGRQRAVTGDTAARAGLANPDKERPHKPKDPFTRLMDLTLGWGEYVERDEAEHPDAVSSSDIYAAYQSVAEFADPYWEGSPEVQEQAARQFLETLLLPLLLGRAKP